MHANLSSLLIPACCKTSELNEHCNKLLVNKNVGTKLCDRLQATKVIYLVKNSNTKRQLFTYAIVQQNIWLTKHHINLLACRFKVYKNLYFPQIELCSTKKKQYRWRATLNRKHTNGMNWKKNEMETRYKNIINNIKPNSTLCWTYCNERHGMTIAHCIFKT